MNTTTPSAPGASAAALLVVDMQNDDLHPDGAFAVRDAVDLGHVVTGASGAISSVDDDWQRAGLGHALTTVADFTTVTAGLTRAAA